MLNSPSGIAVDAAGNVYFADRANHRIRKVDPGGVITTIAGNGAPGFSGDGGPAIGAILNNPSGVAVDAAENVYIADTTNNRIRKVDPSGIINTIAGYGGPAFCGDGGPATSAMCNFPSGVLADAAGNVYIADTLNNRIRKVSLPSTTTVLSTSATSVQYGDPLTLTATVTSGATGTVNFINGSTVLGQETLAGGVATLTTTTLPAGTYVITAVYQSDGNHSSSTSGPVTITVTKRRGTGPNGAALTLTVNNASRPFGQANPAFSNTITGTLVDNDTLASAVTGVPVYSTPATETSPVGSYPVSVSNLMSANYVIAFVNGTLTVTNTDFAVANQTPPQTVSPGALASYTITVTSVGGTFSDMVTLTATGLPQGTNYTFTPSTVVPGASGATSTLAVTAPTRSATLYPTSRIPPILAVLLLPLATLVRRRGKPLRLLLCLSMTLISLGIVTACGGGGNSNSNSNPNTNQQTYTIVITGTNGTVMRSTTATLTVR